MHGELLLRQRRCLLAAFTRKQVTVVSFAYPGQVHFGGPVGVVVEENNISRLQELDPLQPAFPFGGNIATIRRSGRALSRFIATSSGVERSLLLAALLDDFHDSLGEVPLLALDDLLQIGQHLLENHRIFLVTVNDAIHDRVDRCLPGAVCNDPAVGRQFDASQMVDESPRRVILVPEEFVVLQRDLDQRDGETAHARFHARRYQRIIEDRIEQV